MAKLSAFQADYMGSSPIIRNYTFAFLVELVDTSDLKSDSISRVSVRFRQKAHLIYYYITFLYQKLKQKVYKHD